MSQASEGSFMLAKSYTLVSQHHSSFCTNGLQARKSATCRLLKLLASNCQTSAEKLPDFTAEVGEVLLSVSQTSRKEVIFVSYLICKIEKKCICFQ